MSDDVITLVLPRERDFHPVARLVLAGLAARLNLTYESLEDLQLALGGLLERCDGEDGEELTVRLAVEEHAIAAEIGPFESERLRPELERGDDGGGLGLKRLLDTLVDEVELEEAPSGLVVRLLKRVDPAPARS